MKTWKNAFMWFFFPLIVVSVNQTVWPQVAGAMNEPADTSVSRRDTLQIPPITPSPFQRQPVTRGYTSTKSPGLAVLFSAVIPGAGQIYNETYWKPPIIWGLGGFWIYEWITLNDKYQDFRTQFSRNPADNQLKRVRDFYRDERDKFAWYLGALYLVNLLDAYVGASLYDFNVSPDLSGDGAIVPRITATLRLRL